MTVPQMTTVRRLLDEWQPLRASQGCCIEADEEFCRFIVACCPGCYLVGHPSDIAGLVSETACECSDEMYEPEPPLARNADIVAACDVLLATPEGPEKVRSGTWSCVRAARRAGKRVVIVMPDGTATDTQKGD